jgi:hypothetical protein
MQRLWATVQLVWLLIKSIVTGKPVMDDSTTAPARDKLVITVDGEIKYSGTPWYFDDSEDDGTRHIEVLTTPQE